MSATAFFTVSAHHENAVSTEYMPLIGRGLSDHRAEAVLYCKGK